MSCMNNKVFWGPFSLAARAGMVQLCNTCFVNVACLWLLFLAVTCTARESKGLGVCVVVPVLACGKFHVLLYHMLQRRCHAESVGLRWLSQFLKSELLPKDLSWDFLSLNGML